MQDYKRHGARYRARRRAVDILFEAETRDIDPVAIVEDRAELSQDPANAVAPVADYTRTIVAGAAEKLDDLDDAIERHLTEDWELFRLPAVDRQILRVAAWEILFNDEVDAPISIKEGVEMASEYSGQQAARYINVVLDGIAQGAAANAPFAGEAADDAYPVAAEPAAAEPEAPVVTAETEPEAPAAEPGAEVSSGTAEATTAAEAAEIAESTEPVAVDDDEATDPTSAQ